MQYSNTESSTVTEKHCFVGQEMEQQQTQQSRQSENTPLEERRPNPIGETPQAEPAQQESAQRQVHHCANCDIDFFWSPTAVQEKIYCCTGCAAGGPCTCDYSLYRSVTIMGIIHYEL